MTTSVYDMVGHLALFIGTECYRWDTAALVRAARNARAMGCDAIVPKRWDGQIRWYGTPERLLLEKQAVESEGVRYVPFGYLYGKRLGSMQTPGEARIVQEVLNTLGIAVMDMESEWDGQDAEAERLAEALKGHRGTLIVSTWADPIQHNWQGVVKALAPVVQGWGPQQYNNWLGTQEPQLVALKETPILPEIDLTADFGPNDPTRLTQQAITHGNLSVWLWEYQYTLRNPQLVRGLAALMGKAHENMQPVRLPHPQPPTRQRRSTVMVEPGETLYSIAERLNRQFHLSLNWFHDLYLPNRATLDKVASLHGNPNSNRGNLLFPGTTLFYSAS